MTDLDRAIAAAREALADYDAYGMPIDAGTVRDLLAALDAARGQAVACDCDWPMLGNCKSCAPPAAARDETPIDIGGESVPRWVLAYADALTTYFAERGCGSWAIGGVQSREKAPPAVAAPAANVAPLRQPRLDLARLADAISAAVYDNANGLSVTEAIGALEIAKLELLKDQEQ